MKKLVQLVRRIEAGGRAPDLLRKFVADHTFPMVEDGQATFFFWDGQPADEVLLVHWVFGLETSQAFKRIGSTDAFWLTVDLPERSRVEYKLEVIRAGKRSWVRDPLNPRRAYDPFGSNSVVAMTGYADPPWAEREAFVKPGRIETLGVRSEVWGGERLVRVYTPAEYHPRKTYPLLIVHDGDDYLNFARMDAVLDTLIHRHEVMPLVVAFTSGVKRNEEYAANPLQARFLADEVLPALQRGFGVSPDPRERGLMGASFGGVSSLFTAWTRPGLFGQLLLQSGSFVFTEVGHHGRPPLWDPIVKFVNAFREDPARVDARMFLSCGTFESLIYYNRSLVPLLRTAGVDAKFVEARDGHNWVAWRDRLRDGLTWLYPGRLRMIYE